MTRGRATRYFYLFLSLENSSLIQRRSSLSRGIDGAQGVRFRVMKFKLSIIITISNRERSEMRRGIGKLAGKFLINASKQLIEYFVENYEIFRQLGSL